MSKLVKQHYITGKNEKKINCYHVNIPRAIVEASGITVDDDITITAEKNKIIIKKR